MHIIPLGAEPATINAQAKRELTIAKSAASLGIALLARAYLPRRELAFMPRTMHPAILHDFVETARDGGSNPIVRALAAEVPVAVEFNGIGYAVMMMTPTDLGDFAWGFAQAERLAVGQRDILDIDENVSALGIVLRVTLAAARVEHVYERVRHRVSESSCGLCGIDNLEAALRPLPKVTTRSEVAPAAIFRALEQLSEGQPLSRQTGAVHAAALCAADGSIRLVREDVGRHNAFDKLIGAMIRSGLSWDGGFALLTARCSYELVEKAVLADCPLLATISAPTSLAVARAANAGLRLVSLARADSYLEAAGTASEFSSK